ncbi:hypothetical protein M9H77_16303 [Catharanthus roseus]|uniref:Uncharacterized protein n=1 Tax=Catharanthus roseus TaxID=4058 RepID=A0ACC0B1E8_CATRO|nr:hypothetical protein M9H77_16303 [Catharanthus roseus]
MANQTPAAPSSQPRRQSSSLLRIIAIILLSLIILVGLAVLIIWLSVKPRKLIYTIESASIHNYNLSHDLLNATFDFELRAYNPNTKLSIYYDRIETKVTYDDTTLAFNNLPPFYQPRKNVTRLGLNLVSKDVVLFPGISKNLRMEKNSGEIEVEVRVKAKVRFKVGIWKSNHRTLKLLCAPIMVHVSSSKIFDRTYCDIDL